MSAQTRFRLKAEQRATFIVHARNRPDVLLPVVSLFHDLKVEIEAIYMIRGKDAEKVRISVTIQMNREHAANVRGHLANVVGVLSVKTEIGGKNVLGDSPSDEATSGSHL